jgi:carbon-monoxide dehydrogenase medium subunit
MFPGKFEYHRAESVDHALRLLEANPAAKVLAGGHSLVPMLKLRLAQPEAVVDIGRLAELRGIRQEGGSIRIGALTAHAEVARSPVLERHCPLVAEAAGKIADPQVRNFGTVGGNIAHADPASDLPAVLLAVGATIHLKSGTGERRVAARDFFKDLLETDLENGEILTAIEVPALEPGTGSAYLKVEHPASGYALCGAAAVVRLDGGVCKAAALAYNGVAPVPFLAGEAAALVGRPWSAEAAAAALATLAVGDPLTDVQASGQYRVELARVYGRRALALAAERAG